MKHIVSTLFTFLLLMCAAVPARADFAVTSITLSANDLDASAYFPVMDNYKRQCALIKVQVDPPQGGFTFETGSLGVEKVVEKLPEIWVYVPEKTMKIKIMHPKLGVISNSQNNDGYYWFHDKVGKLESGRVYVLKLALDKQVVENIVEVKKRSGFLILNTVPEGAEVYLGPEGGKLEYENVTPFSKKLEYGRYNFRVKKAKYHDDFGLAIINTPQLEFDLQLKPAFGSIDVTSTPSGAQVFLDGENTGKVTPCTLSEVASGEHDVRVMMLNYSPQSSTVTVKDEQTSSVALAMDARFAQVTITSLPGASIKINGEAKDTSSYTENLIEGLYDIEVTLASHRPTTKQIEVVAGVPQSVELTPTPIYGSLDVISQPMKADITINGKNYGYTPTTIENILIGEYDVVLSKEGCATVTEHVSISENATAAINATLPSGRSVTIATDKDGDEIFVDGVKVGVSPCTTELAFGSHEFTAQRGTKRMSKNVSISQDESAHAVRLNFATIKAKVQTRENWLTIESEPNNVDVYLWRDGEIESYCGETPFVKKLQKEGCYYYRLKKNNYLDTVGDVEVKFSKNESSSGLYVNGFEELPFDFDASTYYPKRDWNGNECAIIKISTTQKGFSFDNGALGIVDVIIKPNEIWLYVPAKTMKLKIMHPKLGVISNSQKNDGYYWFKRVEAGKCYKLDLVY